jgi:hypothetical protein
MIFFAFILTILAFSLLPATAFQSNHDSFKEAWLIWMGVTTLSSLLLGLAWFLFTSDPYVYP